jgi:DNA-binding MarR family transcriptional regulator
VNNLEDVVCFGRLIGVLSNEIKRNFDFDWETDELTPKQRRILHFIFARSCDGQVFQKDIEREFNLRRSSASAMLANLEQAEFIKRISSEDDARQKCICVTEKAEKIRAAVSRDCSRMEEKLVCGIPQDELKLCAEVLVKMTDNLSGR